MRMLSNILAENRITGNGYYNEGTDDKLIPNVGITMYEVINLGQDGSYNTEYDNYDYYYFSV